MNPISYDHDVLRLMVAAPTLAVVEAAIVELCHVSALGVTRFSHFK